MNNNFRITYSLMVIIQIIIYGCFDMPFFIDLTILPVLFLFLPVNTGKIRTLILAFVTGLLVDLLGDGVLGLNILSLVFLAYFRNHLITLVFGRGVFARNENISITRHGFGSTSIGIMLFQFVFLLIYILADGAGTRTFGFNLARLSLSLIAGYIAGLFIAFVFSSTSTK